jgi:serine/threonine protein kinase
MGASATSPPSPIGATVGNYRVVSKLGEGGMGAVYLAEHPLIGKKVALKLLHPEYASNEVMVTRFFHEARAVNEIGHPNIVDVVDYGVVHLGDGPPRAYFIMELLAGESLAGALKREGPLAPDRAVTIALQIAGALAASHDKGVVHRDLKPDNVFLVTRGRERDFVKVLDFGIAKLTGGGDRKDPSRTRSGVVMGTPTYMSPEQCESRRDVDRRADVYALGVILYEMLTGQVPFTGEGYGEVILAHVTRRPAPPSSVHGPIPPALDAIVLKALEKRREDRFQSMEELAGALREPERFFRDHGVTLVPLRERANTVPGKRTAAPAASPTTLSRSAAELGVPSRSRVPVIAASAVVVLSLIAGGALLLARREPVPEELGPVPATLPPPAPDAPSPVAAPPPPPVVEPIPVAPAMVTVAISSRPAGASVIVAGEERGTTPMTLELRREDREIEIELRLDGHRPRAQAIKLDRDAELHLALERESRRRRPRLEPVGEPESPPPAQEEPPAPPESSDDEILPPTFGQ